MGRSPKGGRGPGPGRRARPWLRCRRSGGHWPSPALPAEVAHARFAAARRRRSLFYYYGTPLLHGLLVLDTLVVVAIVVAALGLASARFVRKDIGV